MYLHSSTDGEPHLQSVEAIDKRSLVTTWHVTMTTITSLATELPSAQPTDEWTRTPEHKSRQLDEIMTLDVVSPFIVDNSVCAWRRCTVYGELRIAVVRSDAFQCTINDCLRPQRTLDCERKHRGLWTGTWSRIAIAVGLWNVCSSWNKCDGIRNSGSPHWTCWSGWSHAVWRHFLQSPISPVP